MCFAVGLSRAGAVRDGRTSRGVAAIVEVYVDDGGTIPD